MFLTCSIAVAAVAIVLYIVLQSGLEASLPTITFLLIIVPQNAQLQAGVFNLTVQRIVITLVALLFVMSPSATSGARAVYTPLKWLMIVHVCWCLLSTCFSIVPVMSVKKLLAEVAEYYVVYAIYYRTISKKATIRKVLTSMVVAIIVCSGFGAVEAYSEWDVTQMFPRIEHRFSGDPHMDTERGARVKSTFDHPILFGAALTMAITITFYLLATEVRIWPKMLLGTIGIPLMFLNIYKTSSRGPWLALAISLGVVLLFAQKSARRYVIGVLVVIMLVLVARPGIRSSIEGIYANTLDTNTTEGSSYEYRFALRDVAEKALARETGRAMWGYGLESFYFLGMEGEFLGQQHKFLSADSSWIEIAVETGYVGLFLIASLLLLPLWLASHDFLKPKGRDRTLIVVLLVSMFTFYFMMLSVGMYAWGQNGYMLWVVIAVFMAYRSLGETPEAQKALKSPTVQEQNQSTPCLAPPVSVHWTGKPAFHSEQLY